MTEDHEAVTGSSGGGRSTPRHGRRSGPGWRRIARRVVAFGASVLSVGLLVGFGWGWYEYRSLNQGLHQLSLNALAGGSGDLSHQGSPAGQQVHGHEQNILITGLDSRNRLSPAEQRLLQVGDAASTSTDTIMIIHIPADGKHAILISIPRDSCVDIPHGWAKNKINAAYGDVMGDPAFTGSQAKRQATAADLLVATVEQLTGLAINHYIQVGFGGFYTITKAVGSIPVNLCKSMNDTVAHNEATGQGRVGSGFVMSAGHHSLTPLQAFEFVRQRHNLPHEDLDRERRQQYFLAAAFSKIASTGVLLNPVRLNNLISAIDGALYVDTGLANHLTTLADQMIDLSAGNITGYTIPTTSGTAVIANSGPPQDVQIVDPPAVKKWVNEVITGTLPTPHKTANPSGTTPAAGGTTEPAAPTQQKCIN